MRIKIYKGKINSIKVKGGLNMEMLKALPVERCTPKIEKMSSEDIRMLSRYLMKKNSRIYEKLAK